MIKKDYFNKSGRISVEMAELLAKTTFSSNDMEDSLNNLFAYELCVKSDAIKMYGDLSIPEFLELTQEFGGTISFDEIFFKEWKHANIGTVRTGERYIFRPTIYEVQAFLRNKYKKHITIYSCSQESWQYRITEPHQKLEDGIFAEDFETYEDALIDALFVILKQIVKN